MTNLKAGDRVRIRGRRAWTGCTGTVEGFENTGIGRGAKVALDNQCGFKTFVFRESDYSKIDNEDSSDA